jgi:hypothetical protein
MKEYRLGLIYDSPNEEIKIELADILTEKQFESISLAITQISDLANLQRLLNFVLENEADFNRLINSTLQNYVVKSASWNGVKSYDQAGLFLNSNRLFLNYLSSMRTFLDHAEAFMKRTYGKKSSQYQEFQKITSVFFDNSFAYRFFYKLRNYAQHVNLPIDCVRFSASYNQGEPHSIELEVTFNRDQLIAGYDSWSTVKNDLEKMSPRFSAIPLIYEMSHNLKEIERNIELIHKEPLMEAHNTIVSMIQHLKEDGAEIFVAHDFKEGPQQQFEGFESIGIPFDILDYIKTTFM